MEDAAITVRKLTNQFGKSVIHKDLDLDVRRGEARSRHAALDHGQGRPRLHRSRVPFPFAEPP